MAPKAKPKKKKESAEQRKARQDMEALAAAEAEAARQADARRALREQARREAAYTAVNARALDAAWLQRMRAAKLEELQAEAGELSRQHDAQVDRRDRQIEALLEDVAVANSQHAAAATAHASTLDALAELHGARLAALRRQFDGDLAAMQGEFEGEKAELAALHHRQRKELQDSMAALRQAYDDTRAEAAAAYRLMEEDLHSRASEALNLTRVALEGRVKELEGALEAEHRGYVEATGEQEAAYRQLAAADAVAAEAIAQRTARLRLLQETLVQWRGRIVANSAEWQRRNAALAKEKEAVLGHHTQLKGELGRFRATEQARLRQLCVAYASVEAGLQEQLATAQRIMRLAQLSRPHQLPGEAGAAAAEAPAGEAALGASAAEEEAAACSGTASDSPGAMQALGLPAGGAGQRLLEAFSRRCGAAALDAAALERERLRLAAENATLAAVVATVQAGGGVAPGALDDPLNTLCVVNGRLQVALRAAGAQRGQ